MRFKRTLRFICICQKCRCEFKSFKADRKYCDKHRWTDRVLTPAQIIQTQKKCEVCDITFTGKTKFCSDECKKKNHAKYMISFRVKKGSNPRQKKEKVIIQKIEPLRIMDKVKVEPKPIILIAPSVYKRVRINAKTYMEFANEERYLKWVKANSNF